MTAMMRNLGKMSVIGLLKPLSSHAQKVCERLKDEAALRKAKIHPFSVLLALNTYKSGHGERGKLKWEVNQPVVQALDAAFYLAFKVSFTSLLCNPQHMCIRGWVCRFRKFISTGTFRRLRPQSLSHPPPPTLLFTRWLSLC